MQEMKCSTTKFGKTRQGFWKCKFGGRSTYRSVLLGLGFVLTACCLASADEVIFADSFQSQQPGADWKVESGKWRVEDGCLLAENAEATIVLDRPLGVTFDLTFDLEFDIDHSTDRVTFYFDRDRSSYLAMRYMYHGPDDLKDRIHLTERDPDSNELLVYNTYNIRNYAPIVGFRRIRISYDCGDIRLSIDGKQIGHAIFRFNSNPILTLGATLADGKYVKIKNFNISKPASAHNVVFASNAATFANASLYSTDERIAKPVQNERLDVSGDNVSMKYEFKSGDAFESRFVRFPVDVLKGRKMRLELEGDNSKNLFFAVVIDRDGESHIVSEIPLRWQGRQDIGINLTPFLKPTKERTRKHWGGNENQRIDFPITAVEIGVVKRSVRSRNSGMITFGNLRFED